MAPPLRRFPLPGLHVGTDICQVSRIYAILAKKARETSTGETSAVRLVRRILTSYERPSPLTAGSGLPVPALPAHATSSQVLAWLLAGGQPEPAASAPGMAADRRNSHLWKAALFLAGRFAAKEAAIKAHPHLDLSFHHIRIVRTRSDEDNGSGPPVALIKIQPSGPEPCHEQEARLSISHDGDYATAVCLGFEDHAIAKPDS